MKPKIIFIVLLLLIACSPTRGCVESDFTLAPDSRLPKWFVLPSGYSRDMVTVKLTYYSSSPTENTDFELMDNKGMKIAMVSGNMCWHPETKKKLNKYGGLDPDTFPHYVYFRINGILEVIEHTKSPIFRISDDPKLIKEAIDSTDCK